MMDFQTVLDAIAQCAKQVGILHYVPPTAAYRHGTEILLAGGSEVEGGEGDPMQIALCKALNADMVYTVMNPANFPDAVKL